MNYLSTLSSIYKTFFAAPTAQEVYEKQRTADAIRSAQDRADLEALHEAELLKARFAVFNLQMRVEEKQVELAQVKAHLAVARARFARLSRKEVK
jgi:hypothetical protein